MLRKAFLKEEAFESGLTEWRVLAHMGPTSNVALVKSLISERLGFSVKWECVNDKCFEGYKVLEMLLYSQIIQDVTLI